MRRVITFILTIGLVLSAGIAYATNQGYLSLSADIVNPNETVTAQGEGFKPNANVVVTFDGGNSKTVRADSNGNVSISFTIPSSADPGIHTLSAQGPANPSKPGIRVEAYSEPTLVLIGNVQIAKTEVLDSQVTPKTGVKVLGTKASPAAKTELPFTGGGLLWLLLLAGTGLIIASFAVRLLKKN